MVCYIYIPSAQYTQTAGWENVLWYQEAITAGTSREMGKVGIQYVIQLGRNEILNGIHLPLLLKACA